MISPCRCNAKTEAALSRFLGVESSAPIADIKVEFKELPYFLVERSLQKWQPEEQGDINEIVIIGVSDRGLIVDPAPPAAKEQATRQTLIPWSNIVSLSITRAAQGAGGPRTV